MKPPPHAWMHSPPELVVVDKRITFHSARHQGATGEKKKKELEKKELKEKKNDRVELWARKVVANGNAAGHLGGVRIWVANSLREGIPEE